MTNQPYSVAPRTPQRPLRWPEVVDAVRESVRAAGSPPQVYLVGGCVRDALLGKAEFGLHDLDLTTDSNASKLARSLGNELGGAYFPLDRERGVGRVIMERPEGRLVIDVARLRGDDLLADLMDRDFTVNAMAVSLAEPDLLIDPLGGEADLLRHKLLRLCAPTAIADDPIRALRAVRFGLHFGLRLDKETLAAVRADGQRLVDGEGQLVQPERARDELFKLLAGDHPAGAARLLDRLGLLETAFPTLNTARLDTLEHVARLLRIVSPARDDNSAANLTYGLAVMTLDRHRTPLQEHLAASFADDRLLRALLALWVLMEPGAADETAHRLRLSNAERDRLAAIDRGTARFAELTAPLTPRAIHRYFRDIGEAGIDAALLGLAAQLAEGQRTDSLDPAGWGALLDEVVSPLLDGFFRRHQDFVKPPPLVTGDDLIRELGLEPGPELGDLLERLLEEQAAGEIRSRVEALHLAEEWTQ